MDHDLLENLRKNHTVLKLLNADNMPLMISFFYQAFILPSRRAIAMTDLVTLLDDYLFQLTNRVGEGRYPRPAKAYLEEWASGDNAFLRKYYSDKSDGALIDLTPAVEKIFITENKINGLTFPDMPLSLIIFGLGYGVQSLKKVEWLKSKQILYWGDIDTHGFSILSMIRHYFPDIRSFLMDKRTLLHFKDMWVKEPEKKRSCS